VWDFGAAARHHRLYASWMPERQSLAGLFRRAAQAIAAVLKAEGVAGLPLGIDVVEPPFLSALSRLPTTRPARA
jgi:Xaa-Pro dipeptidase